MLEEAREAAMGGPARRPLHALPETRLPPPPPRVAECVSEWLIVAVRVARSHPAAPVECMECRVSSASRVDCHVIHSHTL